MYLQPAEPSVYSFISTISRFSGFFYQCYLIPLAMAVLVLALTGEKRPDPVKVALHTAVTCLIGAGLYFLIAPAFHVFTELGTVSMVLLIGIIVLYAAAFCPLQSPTLVVVTAAVIADINWAQSISTQILMPLMPLNISNLIQFLILAASLALTLLFRPSRSEKVPTAYWVTMLVIAVLSAACLYAVRALGQRNVLYSGSNPALCIVLAAFYLVTLMVYYLYNVLVKEHRTASEMAAMQAKLEQDLEFYRRTDRLTREYGALRHELKNHLSVMDSLLREGRYEQLREYFAEYKGKAAPVLAEFHCPNPIITSVISHQMNTAMAAGVTLDVIAAVPETIGIDDDDLCSLLSNMLDNGVEGCLRAGKSIVRAALHTEKNCLFITVTNPAAEGVLKENPTLASTKTNTASHGFGIPIMRRIAEKYDGIVSFSETDGWFTADAMLYMEDKK